MTSIDEAIAQEKELSGHCKRMFDDMNEVDKLSNKLLKNEIEYHEHLAEWLEELKAYKENQHRSLRHMYEKGYNKALDDFAILMKEAMNHDWATTKICDQIIYNRLFDKCNEIVEKLKVGASDGNG